MLHARPAQRWRSLSPLPWLVQMSGNFQEDGNQQALWRAVLAARQYRRRSDILVNELGDAQHQACGEALIVSFEPARCLPRGISVAFGPLLAH